MPLRYLQEPAYSWVLAGRPPASNKELLSRIVLNHNAVHMHAGPNPSDGSDEVIEEDGSPPTPDVNPVVIRIVRSSLRVLGEERVRTLPRAPVAQQASEEPSPTGTLNPEHGNGTRRTITPISNHLLQWTEPECVALLLEDSEWPIQPWPLSHSDDHHGMKLHGGFMAHIGTMDLNDCHTTPIEFLPDSVLVWLSTGCILLNGTYGLPPYSRLCGPGKDTLLDNRDGNPLRRLLTPGGEILNDFC